MRTPDEILLMNPLYKSAAAGVWLVGAIGWLVLAGCSRSPAPDPTILATVGDRVICAEDVQHEIAWRQSHRRSVPEPAALLEEMISQEALVQKARAAGLEKDPEFHRAWRSLLAAKIKERELVPRVEALQVSAEELRAAHESQVKQQTQPAKARLALVQIKTDPKMSESELAELRSRIEEARIQSLALTNSNNTGFSQVAVAYSEDQSSRYKGGDVGWFDEGQEHYRWPVKVIAAGFALGSTAVSEVIRAENGFYLVKKLDTRAASITTPPLIEERLGRQLLAQKREQAEKAFFQDARSAVGVRTFPEALASLPVTPTSVARRTTDEPPSLP